MVNRITKKNFMTFFHGWGSIALWLVESLWGSGLLFPTKFPEIPGTHFIDLWRMKGWVEFRATHWFSTWDPWIRNPASWPLGHCSIKPVNVFVAWKDVKFQKPYNFLGNTNLTGLCLISLGLNLIVHTKTMWFIIFSTEHPICKTSLRLNWCLIKVKR